MDPQQIQIIVAVMQQANEDAAQLHGVWVAARRRRRRSRRHRAYRHVLDVVILVLFFGENILERLERMTDRSLTDEN